MFSGEQAHQLDAIRLFSAVCESFSLDSPSHFKICNFEKTVDVKAEIERLIEWKFITEQEAASVDVAAIEQFFKGKLYSRIISANEVKREMRFITEN